MLKPKSCSTHSIQEAMIDEIGVRGNKKKEKIAREAVELAVEWSRIVGSDEDGWSPEKNEDQLKESCYDYVKRNHSAVKAKKDEENGSSLSLWVSIPLAAVAFVFLSPFLWLIVGIFITWLFIDELAREEVISGHE